MYHGTKDTFGESIKVKGFEASKNGRLGPGVYFTTTFVEARKIAEFKFGKNGVVIECRAVAYKSLGNEKSINELLAWQKDNIEFCKTNADKGIHPKWANNDDFK